MRALIAGLLALMVAVPAAAKTYSAERFDSRIRILPSGALEIVETVVFRFEGGTFDHVFRDLSRRRTDDIEVISAEMDGRELAVWQRVRTGRSAGSVEGARQVAIRPTR